MKLGTLSIILLLVLALVAAVTVFSPKEEEPDPITISEKAIVHYKNKLMYADVVSEYKILIEAITDDKDLDKITEMYEYITSLEAYETDETLLEGANWARKMAVERDPSDTVKAGEYMDNLCNKGEIEVYAYVKELMEITNDPVHEGKYDEAYQFYYDYYQKIKGTHSASRLDFAEMGGWYADHSVAIDEYGKYYVIDAFGNETVAELASPVMSYSAEDELIAIEHEGQLVYTNPTVQRKRVPYIEDDEELLYYTYLGPFANGLANFCDDKGQWGYLKSTMEVYQSGLQGATPVQRKIFAIKSKDSWKAYYFTGGEPGEFKDFDFAEIYQNEFGCFLGGIEVSTNVEAGTATLTAILYAKEKSDSAWVPYKLTYTTGDEPVYKCEKLGNDTYAEVKLFGETAGAVKTANGWGFIDTEGNLMDMGGKFFDDADSFVCGVAPAMLGGEWGYINEKGEFVISAGYTTATVMSSKGTAIVWDGEDKYYLLMLKEYME